MLETAESYGNVMKMAAGNNGGGGENGESGQLADGEIWGGEGWKRS